MTLRQLKNVLSKLSNFLGKDKKQSQAVVQVNEVYTYIVDNVKTGLDQEITGTWSNTAKQLNLDLDLTFKEKNKIRDKKVKGKSIFQRIMRNKDKLITDTKKIIKEKDAAQKKKSLKDKFRSEYFKLKRIVRTDTHRIKENTKSYLVDKAENVLHIELDKTWKCMFRNSRDAHIAMHNQIADEDGYFTAPSGEKTKYPGGFGVANLDINCNCKIVLKRKVK